MNVAQRLAVLGCVSWGALLGGCSAGHDKPAHGFADELPGGAQPVRQVILHQGRGPEAGALLEYYQSETEYFKALFVGADAGMYPQTTNAALYLTQGWVYVNGKFPAVKPWYRWPVVITQGIEVGADGTTFIVWSDNTNTTNFVQRVFCLEGTVRVSSRIYLPSPPKNVPAGSYAEYVTTNGVQAPVAIKTTPTTAGDPIGDFVKAATTLAESPTYEANKH